MVIVCHTDHHAAALAGVRQRLVTAKFLAYGFIRRIGEIEFDRGTFGFPVQFKTIS